MIAHLEFLEGSGARTRRWLAAGVMMVSMHAAAGALAVMNWPEEATSDEDAGAFMVELAPVPVAPPTEKLNLAIGPRAEEAAAAVAPTEEIKEELRHRDAEGRGGARSPLSRGRRAKADADRGNQDRRSKGRPATGQKAIPQQSVASQETSAPPPVDAPHAENRRRPSRAFPRSRRKRR